MERIASAIATIYILTIFVSPARSVLAADFGALRVIEHRAVDRAGNVIVGEFRLGRQAAPLLVALGAVIRGETYHFEIVSNESAAGISSVAQGCFDDGVAAIQHPKRVQDPQGRIGGRNPQTRMPEARVNGSPRPHL